MGTLDPAAESRARAFSVRMFLAMLATQELLATYLGVRLGLYEALAAAGPATPGELAARVGVDARYAREWLEQQAVAGILSVEDGASPEERTYSLPPGHEDVLTVSESPLSIVSLAVLPLGGVARALPRLLEAYRTGDGVPDGEYGDDWRDGHSGANRALYTGFFARWLETALPDVHERLSAAGARAADVACGAGHAAIALASAYPGLAVDGFDIDAETVEAARRNVAAAGLDERVTIEVRDGADPTLGGGYDLVCVLDSLHEMSHPVDVLRSCRALRAERGCVLVMDAKVAPAFHAPADEVERFQYATSVLHCLPVALVDRPSSGTGTVLRVDAVRRLAREAGFSGIDVLPAPEDRFHNFYRLVG